MQRRQKTGKWFAILIAFTAFFQLSLASHLHADDGGSAPGPSSHDCAICVLGAAAGNDDVVPASDSYLPGSVSTGRSVTSPAHTAVPLGLPRFAQRPRAPPPAFQTRQVDSRAR